MKAAIEAGPWTHLLARRREPTLVFYKLAGLLITVGFPTLFWVLALLLVSNAFGASTSASALSCFSLAVAAICLLGTAVVIGDRRYDPTIWRS